MLKECLHLRDFEYRAAQIVVFLRAVTGIENMTIFSLDVYCLIDNSELDRTDWYAYSSDKYGTIEPDEFKERKTPGELFNLLRKDFNMSNEIMLRRGVGINKIKAIIVGGSPVYDRAEKRNNILKTLRRRGITDVGGVPINKFIITHDKFVGMNGGIAYTNSNED